MEQLIDCVDRVDVTDLARERRLPRRVEGAERPESFLEHGFGRSVNLSVRPCVVVRMCLGHEEVEADIAFGESPLHLLTQMLTPEGLVSNDEDATHGAPFRTAAGEAVVVSVLRSVATGLSSCALARPPHMATAATIPR